MINDSGKRRTDYRTRHNRTEKCQLDFKQLLDGITDAYLEHAYKSSKGIEAEPYVLLEGDHQYSVKVIDIFCELYCTPSLAIISNTHSFIPVSTTCHSFRRFNCIGPRSTWLVSIRSSIAQRCVHSENHGAVPHSPHPLSATLCTSFH